MIFFSGFTKCRPKILNVSLRLLKCKSINAPRRHKLRNKMHETR